MWEATGAIEILAPVTDVMEALVLTNSQAKIYGENVPKAQPVQMAVGLIIVAGRVRPAEFKLRATEAVLPVVNAGTEIQPATPTPLISATVLPPNVVCVFCAMASDAAPIIVM